MFSYNVFELIASFGSIRDYVRMMRIAISDAPSNLVERRCATYKKKVKWKKKELEWERQLDMCSEYSDNSWCGCYDPDDAEADDRICSGIDDWENEYWWYGWYRGKFHDDDVMYRIQYLYYNDLGYLV